MLELTWRGTEHLQRRVQIYFSEKKWNKSRFWRSKKKNFTHNLINFESKI